MIFLLGEHRHIKYFVHSVKNEYFIIKEAHYQLMYKGKLETEGVCEIEPADNGSYLDIIIEPKEKSVLYELILTLRIADEIIMHKEKLEVY